MTDQDRRRIETLFDLALELPEREREEFIASSCADHPRQLVVLRSLLAAHHVAEQIFPDGDGDDELKDRWIGPYRVLREIGRGGMGLVYLAERADGQYRRRVAIKVIATAQRDDPVHQRFLAERQILAGLDHPNIARLLDGGVSADGCPYLVLEYVDGVPITTYCNRNLLTLQERLELFIEVCGAVQHAHKNLVIHRDLKPANILVTAERQVRLLDFGIAKILNADLSAGGPPLTRMDHRVMTPEYASPEQVRGGTLTTASDIYSLGTLLYELLTGSPPYRLETGSPVEVLEAVCGRDPERPSTRVRRTEQTTGEHDTEVELSPDIRGAQRATTAERLRRSLQGDLDSIILMALRKEPERRYGSVDLFAQDIRRHLARQPVAAHSGDARYRLAKFVRRHRRETIAALLALLSLLGGAGTAVWQGRLAERAREHAETERATAELALRQSEAVTAFLMELFEASDPEVAQGDSITARELLERGVRRAEALSAEPAVQARMFGVMGRVYQSLGDLPSAQALHRRAYDLQLGRYGVDHPEMVDPLVNLADVLRRRAVYDSARVLLERALAIQLRSPDADDAARGRTLHELSRTALLAGDLASAERLGSEALSLRQRALGTGHTSTVESTTHLSRVLRERGDHAAAEQVLREAIDPDARLAGDPGPLLAPLLELADLLQYDRRNGADAEPLYRRALVALRSAPVSDPAQQLRALGGLARILEERGELAAAEVLLQESVELRRHIYGAEHPVLSAGLIHLAGFYERTARPVQAEQLFRSVAEVDLKLFGEDHPTHAGTLGAIARTLIAQNRLDEADSLLQRQHTVRVARLGAAHPLVSRTLYWRAEVQLRRGNYAGADTLLHHALSIANAQASAETSAMRDIYRKLADVSSARGRPEESARFRELAGAQ